MRMLAWCCCCLMGGLLLLQAWVDAADRQPVQLLESRCTVCHDLERVRDRVGSRDGAAWETLIARMQGNGANVSDEEKQILARHLGSLVAPDF